MVTRMHFTQVGDAERAAEAIDEAGYEVALVTEDVDGEQSYLVATPASADQIENLVPPNTVLTDDSLNPRSAVLDDDQDEDGEDESQ